MHINLWIEKARAFVDALSLCTDWLRSRHSRAVYCYNSLLCITCLLRKCEKWKCVKNSENGPNRRCQRVLIKTFGISLYPLYVYIKLRWPRFDMLKKLVWTFYNGDINRFGNSDCNVGNMSRWGYQVPWQSLKWGEKLLSACSSSMRMIHSLDMVKILLMSCIPSHAYINGAICWNVQSDCLDGAWRACSFRLLA